jgi:hypothetical protein
MTSTELEVIHAKTALDRATEAQRKEQRASWTKQLTDNRAQLRTARHTYIQLAQQIKTEDELRRQIQNRLNQVLVAVDEHWRQRSPVADFLTADPEVVEWQNVHTLLEGERDKLMAQRDAVPRTNKLEAIEYEGPNGRIAMLERVEANLINALNGSIGKLVEGGIFPVL